MTRGHPVKLDAREFKTKGNATAHFKSMLARYQPGDCVDESDAKDLASLLKRHSEATEKFGNGIDHFEVMSADYSTKCFRVVRSDGTMERFSYRHCINGSDG